MLLTTVLDVARRLIGQGVEPSVPAVSVGDMQHLEFLKGQPSLTVRTYLFCGGNAPMADGHGPDCPWLRRDEVLAALERAPTEQTPDGHPQVWLLYRPEPFAPGSDDDRSLHLWVRRADIFTSREVAIAHLDKLLGHQVRWDRYAELHGGFWPELWIGFDQRGYRWLMEPAPVNPPGGRV